MRWSSTLEAASDPFGPPDGLDIAVTGDERYANETLALSGLPRRGR